MVRLEPASAREVVIQSPNTSESHSVGWSWASSLFCMSDLAGSVNCAGAAAGIGEEEQQGDCIVSMPCVAPKAVQPDKAVADRVTKFCEEIPALRAEPNLAEVRHLWEECCQLAPNGRTPAGLSLAGMKGMSMALREQMSEGCPGVWQQQLRALRILAFSFGLGPCGRGMGLYTMAKAEALVRHLASDPVYETNEVASRVLLIWQLAQVLPAGQEVQVADNGGLLHFTAVPEGAAYVTTTTTASSTSIPGPSPPASGPIPAPAPAPARAPTAPAPASSTTTTHCGPAAPGTTQVLSTDLLGLSPRAVGATPSASASASTTASVEAAANQGWKTTLDSLSEIFGAHTNSAPRRLGERAPLAMTQHFSLAGEEVEAENEDLDKMYSFSPPKVCQQASSFPALGEAWDLDLKLPSRPDPFGFIADHLQHLRHRPPPQHHEHHEHRHPVGGSNILSCS